MKRSVIMFSATMMLLMISGCQATNDLIDAVPVETPAVQSTESNHTSQVNEGTQEGNDEKRTVYPLTIRNFNFAREEIEITFEKPPEKVLAVYQNSIETLLALGLEDRILAAAGLDHRVKSEYAEQFEQVNYLTEFAPDKETVIMMQPDFIVSWYSFFGENTLGEVDYWHENGINTYMKRNSGAIPNERDLNNEYEDILTMGKIFDVQEKAEAIVEEIKSEIDMLLSLASEEDIQRRVLVMEFGRDTIRVYGEATLAGDMVLQLGADLITTEGNSIGQEDLIVLDPDTIFVIYMDRDDENVAEESVNRVLDEPKFASLQAVQNKTVYAIPLGEVFCSGIRTIDGIQALARGIYPELYQ